MIHHLFQQYVLSAVLYGILHTQYKYLRRNDVLVQTMNILIVNQSVIDMCASFFTLLTAVVEVDGTPMSRDSIYDQFICRFWLTRAPLWSFLVTSTYGILLTALDRYVAVIFPTWYKVSFRTHGGDRKFCKGCILWSLNGNDEILFARS